MEEVVITPEMIEEARLELTKPGALYEEAVEVIHGVETRVYTNLLKTMPDYYKKYCEEFAERELLVWYEDRWTFTQVYEQAAIVAHVLKEEMKVGKGDRVAIACRNYPEWIFALMGITSIGAIAVAINSWWSGEELEYGLKNSGATIAFLDQERAKRLGDRVGKLGLQTIVIRGDGDLPQGGITFDDFMAKGKGAAMPEVDMDTDDDTLIMYTSGSTGHPKGAVCSHRNILTALFSWNLGRDLMELLVPDPERPPGVPEIPAILCNLPLFHVSACYAQFLSSLLWGRKVVMMYKWDTEEALQLIEKERITTFNGPGTMDWDLMESPSFSKTDLSSLVSVGGGGAPRPAENVARIDKEFPHAAPGIGWGMTETNAIGSGVAGPDYLARPNCTGVPASILDMKIVDPDENEVPTGEQGELWVKGAAVIRGYWNRPKDNAETFTDGWLHTGDIGYFDEEGFLYICDRIKDMILRGGENVYCAEIESVLYDHPSVFEATVFGVPDKRLGEVVATVVVPRDGEKLTDTDIQEYIGSRMAKFKVPEFVWFSEEPLLRNASEKILKREIRDRIVEAHFSDVK